MSFPSVRKSAVAVLLAASVAHSEYPSSVIVQNGDFEQGDLTGWRGSGVVVPFDVHGGNGITLAYKLGQAPSGSLTQDVHLIAGVEYILAWEQAFQNEGTDQSESGVINVTIGQQLLSSWQQGVTYAGQVTSISEGKMFTVKADGTYSLAFSMTVSTGINAYLDNISITASSGVPAVSEYGLFAMVILAALAGKIVFSRSNMRKMRAEPHANPNP